LITKSLRTGILHTSRPTAHQKRGQLVDVEVYECPQAIENMVARDGVEPPTLAFSDWR
jgi:hypothetical protein